MFHSRVLFRPGLCEASDQTVDTNSMVNDFIFFLLYVYMCFIYLFYFTQGAVPGWRVAISQRTVRGADLAGTRYPRSIGGQL